MGRTIYKQKMDVVFVLVVFCVFAVSMLTVLTLGAGVYRNISEKIQKGYEEQTCLSYIWAKAKNGDRDGQTYITDFHDLRALCFEETYDSVRYVTMIYLYDGWVREIYSEYGVEFYPEDGMPVIESGSLSFEQTESGIIRAESQGNELVLYPRARSGLILP